MSTDAIRLPTLSPELKRIVVAHFGASPRVVDLVGECLAKATYDADLFSRLVALARGEEGDSWPPRLLATLMAENQFLKITPRAAGKTKASRSGSTAPAIQSQKICRTNGKSSVSTRRPVKSSGSAPPIAASQE